MTLHLVFNRSLDCLAVTTSYLALCRPLQAPTMNTQQEQFMPKTQQTNTLSVLYRLL